VLAFVVRAAVPPKGRQCHSGQDTFDANKLSGCSDKSTAGSASCCSEQVKEDMDVVASCGTKIGVVDRVEGESIKLTKKDSPDGHHHRIPNTWLDHVDSHVHLNKNSEEAMREWQAV